MIRDRMFCRIWICTFGFFKCIFDTPDRLYIMFVAYFRYYHLPKSHHSSRVKPDLILDRILAWKCKIVMMLNVNMHKISIMRFPPAHKCLSHKKKGVLYLLSFSFFHFTIVDAVSGKFTEAATSHAISLLPSLEDSYQKL